MNPDQRSVIVKLHGFVDRETSSGLNDDSYVITEDHYIEYLARMDLDNLIPVKALERLRKCDFRFRPTAWRLGSTRPLDKRGTTAGWACWVSQPW